MEVDGPRGVVRFEYAEQRWGEFVIGFPSVGAIEYLREIDTTEQRSSL